MFNKSKELDNVFINKKEWEKKFLHIHSAITTDINELL